MGLAPSPDCGCGDTGKTAVCVTSVMAQHQKKNTMKVCQNCVN